MSLRVGILTSDEVRHRYFANAVAERHDVVAVGYQDTGYVPADTDRVGMDDRTAEVVRAHFDERRRQEVRFFGDESDMLEAKGGRVVRRLNPRTLNSVDTVEMLTGKRVDVVVVYGTSLIKSPLLDRFAGRMVNMHLGLSPYYRGTATNFYPLLNEEPEFVGATIHLIDEGIDSGAIIHHARPEIEASDAPHTVGCKAIAAGVEAMLRALDAFAVGRVETTPQWSVDGGRLYLRKDYHPSQVVRLYELVDDGLFRKYVDRMGAVRDAFRLVP